VVQPATAAAQTGRISGTVTDSANVPLSGAQITVVGRAMRAGSDESGRFVITGVAPGTYELRAQRLGQRVVTMTGVVVRANEVTNVSIVLGRVPIQLSSIVVSASRRTEKITEAPATLTRLDVQEIQNSVGNSFGGALKQVKGLDYIQLGIMSVAVNARGFNSAFNNRVLQLEDGRIAVLPESGLPLGSFTTIPKVDISSVEVLVGPGSALYGPDASRSRRKIRVRSKARRSTPPAGRAASTTFKGDRPPRWAIISPISCRRNTSRRRIGTTTSTMRR
jgi:iron complex outermembrane receptor protein